MPAGAHALIWRVVLDPRIPDGLTEVLAGWTLDDLQIAGDLLDQCDRQAARARMTRHG